MALPEFAVNLVYLDSPNETLYTSWVPRQGELIHIGGPDGREYRVASTAYDVLEHRQTPATVHSVTVRLTAFP